MLEERERACDESVVASGHDPEVYAGGILKVCKFCIQSPLAYVSGISGADLGMRVRQIMTAEAARDVGAGQRMLLVGACIFTLALPVTAGFVARSCGDRGHRILLEMPVDGFVQFHSGEVCFWNQIRRFG